MNNIGLGHEHEWEEMWWIDHTGYHVRKVGWVYCHICNSTKQQKAEILKY